MNAKEITPKANARMNRIKKVIKLVRFLVSSAVILLVVFGLAFFADLAGFSIFQTGVKVSFSPLLTYTAPFSIPAIVLILALLRGGLFLVGVLVLFWLLDLFEAGDFFTAQSVRHIKLLSALVIVDWIFTKILDAMARTGIDLTFSQLVLGLLIFLIAWIMDEGRKIQEEQELTV
jgi:hypothetical protein